jgi:hypothetical protein
MINPKGPYVAIWEAGIGIAKLQGWDFTAECMENAINGHGESRTYYNNSYISDLVKSNSKYRATVNEFISTYKSTGQTYFTREIEFYEPRDLYASIQHADIQATVESNGNMLVTITDMYDYDKIRTTMETLKKLDSSDVFNAANDFGLIAQSLGVLTKFHITIYSYEWAGTAGGDSAAEVSWSNASTLSSGAIIGGKVVGPVKYLCAGSNFPEYQNDWRLGTVTVVGPDISFNALVSPDLSRLITGLYKPITW